MRADQIIHTIKMSLYTSVCNSTVVMWPLFIGLIVKNNTGKIYVTQGKLRENTGNFILARMWPPWIKFKPFQNVNIFCQSKICKLFD